jgi:hypothetical protein
MSSNTFQRAASRPNWVQSLAQFLGVRPLSAASAPPVHGPRRGAPISGSSEAGDTELWVRSPAAMSESIEVTSFHAADAWRMRGPSGSDFVDTIPVRPAA